MTAIEHPPRGRTDADTSRRDIYRAEMWRIFSTSRWVGPIGVAALTTLTVILLADDVPHAVLAAWSAAAFAGGALQVMANVVPRMRRWRDPSGLPRLTAYGHLLVGVTYGSLLWLDPAMVERTDLRSTALVVVFALSAGAASGLAGLHRLGLRVLVPLFVLTAAALATRGEPILAAAAIAFLLIQFVDQIRSERLWRQLVELRVDQEQLATQQRWLAEHDELTGLLNRVGLNSWADRTEGWEFTALYLDLDRFKEVNDTLGHRAGDEVLRETAARITTAVRSGDAAVRLGGDEFLVIAASAFGDERMALLGEALIEQIRRPISTSAGTANVSASIGIASVRRASRHQDVLDVIADADHALLDAKRSGRGRVLVSPRNTLTQNPQPHSARTRQPHSARTRQRPMTR